MFNNMSFGLLSILYILVLMWSFFRKKHIESSELKIFKYLLIISFCGLLIELSINCSIYIFNWSNNITELISKLLLVYFVAFPLVFLVYVLSICKEKDIYEKNKKKYLILFLTIGVIATIVTMSLPIYIEYGDSPYSYGPSVSFIYGYSAIIITVIIIELLISIKKIKEKNYIPLIFYILGSLIIAGIQKLNPALTLSTSFDALLLFIMYFTVENPDVKMLEQMELAKDAAEKANRAKTDFLSSMSHEIRTPLNAIVGFSDCIMDAKDLGEAKTNARDIVNASQTLLEIVNGILDISKIEAGKLEIVNSKYDAKETFEELAKLITPKMKEKGLDFTYKIAPDLPLVLFGDHANLKKIVTNLLSNACKYTEQGYVHYEVNCVNTGNISKLIISVEDSGRGIKQESVNKLFTKFQRLEEDRNTTIEGTGLGLAITKQLIELMGGKIIVHTVYGEGSKFTVVLNQKIEAPDTEVKHHVKTTLDLNNVRILIVDDTPLNLKVTCKLLERYHANQVVTCDSGFECIDRIKRGEIYDLILLDDMMPKMSGVITLKKLKEMPGFKIPTVALTANAITGMREKYLADGFDDYLAKPIEKEQLIQVINQILGRNATEDLGNLSSELKKELPVCRDDVLAVESINEEEKEKQQSVIPVEDNIEEILGDSLNRNYSENNSSSIDNNIQSLAAESNNISADFIVPVVPLNVDVTRSFNPTSQDLKSVNDTSYGAEYLKANGVDLDHALELLGDMEMYNMTISDFVKEVEEKWGRIVDYKNKSDMPNYAIEVHSLKSDCKYLGFMTLADISYQHELKSKENDINFVGEHFNELFEEYKKVLDIARTYVEHNSVSE